MWITDHESNLIQFCIFSLNNAVFLTLFIFPTLAPYSSLLTPYSLLLTPYSLFLSINHPLNKRQRHGSYRTSKTFEPNQHFVLSFHFNQFTHHPLKWPFYNSY